jgi:hypothetical protein
MTDGEAKEMLYWQDPAYYEARRFDYNEPPPPIQPVYTLAGQAICTRENLTTINAAVKSGKSAVVGAMISAAMIDTADQSPDALGFCSENPKEFALLHFDSEQSSPSSLTCSACVGLAEASRSES